ncbi:MAG: ABC transporter permease [Clostridia bacterium]|nr:ABC transporter permease [Clostridia bacterium]
MRTARAFIKRNTLEILRDPLQYIFCLGFPVVMIVLFQVINKFTAGNTPVFDAPSLIPGIIMFSFTFVMLSVALLTSKDRTSAFLVRLYTSPMRTVDFVLGYTVPCFVVGVGQEVVCIAFGWIVSLIVGGTYFSFGAAMLLMIGMLPILLICIFLGVLIGSVLNDKAAPGITSVLISAAGILGGAWMPLDTMGGFETFCRVLPFYPSVYIGRIITGAMHTPMGAEPPAAYAFDSVAALGFIPIAVCLVASVILAVVAFRHNMKSDKK